MQRWRAAEGLHRALQVIRKRSTQSIGLAAAAARVVVAGQLCAVRIQREVATPRGLRAVLVCEREQDCTRSGDYLPKERSSIGSVDWTWHLQLPAAVVAASQIARVTRARRCAAARAMC
eukprot:SAG31_NODE_5245_length_2652_cov_2.870008_1_plen_119_part_00